MNGALSNLQNAARKVDRLLAAWTNGLDSPPLMHKDALDDAFDAINYLGFFIRNARLLNLFGNRTPMPDTGESIARYFCDEYDLWSADGTFELPDGTVIGKVF